MVSFSGFGPAYSATTYLQEGEWDSGIITLSGETAYPTSFIMASDGNLKRLHVRFATEGEISFAEGATVQPFACLAIAETDEPVYRILTTSMVYTETYEGGVVYPENTIRRGARKDLDIAIPEGAVVGIVAGIMASSVSEAISATFMASGGLYLQ